MIWFLLYCYLMAALVVTDGFVDRNPKYKGTLGRITIIFWALLILPFYPIIVLAR